MMTPWDGNAFQITGPLWVESTVQQSQWCGYFIFSLLNLSPKMLNKQSSYRWRVHDHRISNSVPGTSYPQHSNECRINTFQHISNDTVCTIQHIKRISVHWLLKSFQWCENVWNVLLKMWWKYVLLKTTQPNIRITRYFYELKCSGKWGSWQKCMNPSLRHE